MTTVHVGLACSSEANADRFYRDLLGLKKAEPKTLRRSLSKAIFNIDSDLKVINYSDSGSHFEVFIHSECGTIQQPINHISIEVEDLTAFLNKGRAMNVKLLQVPKDGIVLSFAYDFDGNLFELKEKLIS